MTTTPKQRRCTLLALLASTQTIQATSLYSQYYFNPLKHLAGVAPYFEPQDPPTSPSLPQGCTPSKAAYLTRHAAIYANDFDYEEYIEPFVAKLQNHTGIHWSRIPTLDFLSSWSAPVSAAEEELLTRVGKLEAAQLGTSLSFRYPTLNLPQRIWTSSAERTFESAKSLARGLELGDDQVRVVSVYESEEAGADSLTPYKSCPAYSSSAGSDQATEFIDIFTKPIRLRLNELAPSFNFTASDVFGMMELCGYESVIRGSSPFCSPSLFTPDEWLAWEYASDILYHYNVGYGNDVSGTVGLPWLNATAQLLMKDETRDDDVDADTQDLYISFTHRELPPMVLVAMGLFNNSAFNGGSGNHINSTMPLDKINHRRAWRSSHILPFLANIAVERLQCRGSHGFEDGAYFRVLVNNAPQDVPSCSDGPGTSCSLSSFADYVDKRTRMFSGFSEKCGVEYHNSTDTMNFYTDPSVGNGTLVGRKVAAAYGFASGLEE